MASKIQLKRSAVASKVPTTTDLDLGEIGVNTYDGKVYIKKDSGTASIVEVTGPGVAPGTSGNVLTSNGTIWTSTAPTAPTPSLRPNGPYINESDLIEGSSNTNFGAGQRGTIDGWMWESDSSSNGVSRIPGETNHPGIMRLNGSSTGGGYRYLTTGEYHLPADINTFVTVVRMVGASNNNGRFGWTNNPGSGSPTHAAWFGTSGGAWHCITRSAGSVTDNTGSSFTYGNWYELKIIRNSSGNFEFYVNGTLQFTNSTNVPTAAMTPGCFNFDATNTNHVDVDYIGVLGKTYTQRYT